MKRLLTHLFARSSASVYPLASLERIAAAVAAGEARHLGEIRFAVEASLTAREVLAGRDARDRAVDVFSQLRVWDTQANNGVLIYLLLADHRIEIVADRGLDDCVSAEQWRGVCQLMEERLRAGEAEEAAVAAINAVSDLLAQHFPRNTGTADRNELPDMPQLLR